jgi:membrane protein DedA with SNARE-associated domain
VFALAFCESLPFASLVLHFWAVLVGTRTIVGAADPLIFLGLSVAAAAAGRGPWRLAIVLAWPLRNHPRLLERGRAFFERWAYGRSCWRASPARCAATVPLVAGIAEMPPLRFQIANWTSAFLWAFVLLSPGSWGVRWLLEYLR